MLRERRLEVCDPLNTSNIYFSICILNSWQNNEVFKWHRLISDWSQALISGWATVSLRPYFSGMLLRPMWKNSLWHTLRQKFSNSKSWSFKSVGYSSLLRFIAALDYLYKRDVNFAVKVVLEKERDSCLLYQPFNLWNLSGYTTLYLLRDSERGAVVNYLHMASLICIVT